MTDPEIMFILQELHGAGLANEPKDPQATLSIWRDFFGGDDARVIGKAVWIHLRKSKFWPTPADLLKYMQRAKWLVEMEAEKMRQQQRNAIGGGDYNNPKQECPQEKIQMPPMAPAVHIGDQVESFCQLCGLCEIRDQSQCLFDF